MDYDTLRWITITLRWIGSVAVASLDTPFINSIYFLSCFPIIVAHELFVCLMLFLRIFAVNEV